MGLELAMAGILIVAVAGWLLAGRLHGAWRSRAAAEQAQHVAEARMAALRRLAAGVAHDLNNQLTVLLGMLDLLAAHPADEREAAHIDRMQEAAERAASLTARLHGLTTPPAQPPRPVRLEAILPPLQPLLADALGDTVALEISLPAGLWPILADPAAVEWDLLTMVLAGQDASAGARRLRLAAANRPAGAGAGADTVRLALHAGSTLLRAQDFPRATDQAVSGTPIVLLVDDDEAVRSTTAEVLTERGYTVRAAGSGAAALALLESGVAVDVVVSDIAMPAMDGSEFADRLARSRPRLPVVFLTGGAVAGATMPLGKPFRAAELVARIEAALASVTTR